MRSEKVKWQVVDEEGILVNLDTGYYFNLNPVALFIWAMCDGDHSVDTILTAVIDDFDVDEITARRDLEAFLSELATEELVDLIQPNMPTAG